MTTHSRQCIDTSIEYKSIEIRHESDGTFHVISTNKLSSDIDTYICKQCCKNIRADNISVSVSRQYVGVDIPRMCPSLLHMLSATKCLDLWMVDCSNIVDEICSFIATNTQLKTLILRRTNVDVNKILLVAASNTTIRSLEVLDPHKYDDLTYTCINSFIKTNHTCVEFNCRKTDSMTLCQRGDLLDALKHNFTLMSLNNITADDTTYSNFLYSEIDYDIKKIISRNHRYTRKYMNDLLLNITIAFSRLLVNDIIPPYVLVDIFDLLEPHYNKFLIKGKIAMVLKIKSFVENLRVSP